MVSPNASKQKTHTHQVNDHIYRERDVLFTKMYKNRKLSLNSNTVETAKKKKEISVQGKSEGGHCRYCRNV